MLGWASGTQGLEELYQSVKWPNSEKELILFSLASATITWALRVLKEQNLIPGLKEAWGLQIKSCILHLGTKTVVANSTQIQHRDWEIFHLKARRKIITGCVIWQQIYNSKTVPFLCLRVIILEGEPAGNRKEAHENGKKEKFNGRCWSGWLKSSSNKKAVSYLLSDAV